MIVDASVWVSRFLANDDHHHLSSEWLLEQLSSGVVLVSPVILLAEVGSAVARQSGRPKRGQRAVDYLINMAGLYLVDIDLQLGRFAAEVATMYSLRGADAVYVALAHRLSVPLVSWDGEHLTRGGRLVKVITPS
jgi:predicted nucleic acid-binding protein